ncbi:MAG: hypothetical protein IIX43_07985 [Bacteroidales bacterium]|nr:hypothetical protein [Bacteroidales bacterium]
MNYAEVFKRFESLNVIIIGDVMIDSYWWGKVDRISPEAPVPVCTVTKKEHRLGGAANVALNIVAMGANPIVCSVIGNDAEGKLLTELFASNQMSVEGIVASKNRCTTVKTRIIGNNSQMLRIDEEKNDALSENDQIVLIEKVKQIIDSKKIDALIFQDYDKGVITQSVIEKITSMAKNKSIPVCVDPKKRNFSEYKNADLFKPNLKELKEGLKIDNILPQKDSLKSAADILHSTMGIGKVFITLSEYGVFIADYQSQTPNVHLLDAQLRKIADVSGAGDTVISVAALCMALGIQTDELAKISNMSGGLVCESVGVVPIDKTRLLSELQRYE